MELRLHRHMTNQEIAEVLEFVSEILAAKGADRFRAAAYENAAAAIKVFPKQLHEMFLTDPDFDKVPAVGEALNQKLTELFTTGNVKALQKYVADVPAGTYALVQVHGIGGKRALFLANQFHLFDEDAALEKLLHHAQAGDIRDLPGFGEKSEKDIIEQLTRHQTGKQRMPRAQAQQIADQLIAVLKKNNDVIKVEALGSLRRESPTVGDIDLGIAVKSIGPVKNYVKNMETVKNIVVEGDQLMRVFLADGTQVDIKVAPPEEWGSFLQHFTGSKEHNIKLREYALEKQMSLSEHGIKLVGKDTQLKFSDEKEFYKTLGLHWIPPQERIGKDEISKYLLQ